jgi:hypothetical protein
MRSLILTIALMVASLGAMAVTPGRADARPPRYWNGTTYYGPYYSNGYWYGGTHWRPGMVWRPRYYGTYSAWPYSGSYWFPQGYYYGTYVYPGSSYYGWP